MLKREALAVWLAARDPRTPLTARMLAAVVAAYAFSPIDLIPDFIPVMGLLDDLVVVPLGIWLVLRLIPPALMAELRDRAAAMADRPVSRLAALGVVLIWLGGIGAAGWLILR